MTRKRRAPFFALALLASGAFVTGCGPGEEKPPALEIDACQLFPFKEALAAAGEAGIAGTLSSTLEDVIGTGPLQCVYTDGASERPRVLSLQVRPFASRKEAQGVFHSTESRLGQLAGVEPVTVPGLGEKAVWGGGQIGQLHVLHHHLVLVFTSQGAPDDATGLASARAVAEKVLPRIAALEQAAAAPKK